MVFFADAYFSALLRYGVYDAEGKYLGRLDDILVRPHERFPLVTTFALRLEPSGEILYIPWTAVRNASSEGLRLDFPVARLEVVTPEENELHLRRDLIDQQIVDVSGRRVVRVHDLKLGAIGTRVLLTHADVGWRGMMRRLGWEHFVLGLLRLVRIHVPERLIAWEHLHTPEGGGALKADRARDVLRRIQPADLADIAEELSAPDRAAFLGSMDVEVAADAMQEMEPEALAAAVSELPDALAAELVDEMEPDAGADLLADLPQERAEAILGLMEPGEAHEMRRLLSFPEDSAGGLMTPEVVAVPAGITVGEALELVRREGQEVPALYYVHVVDVAQRLVGVFSLRELIIAEPEQMVEELMTTEVVSVPLEARQEEIAHVAARYNLLAVPVVDEEGRLQGIVTADDAIDAVIPTSWKKRIPKAFAR